MGVLGQQQGILEKEHRGRFERIICQLSQSSGSHYEKLSGKIPDSILLLERQSWMLRRQVISQHVLCGN